MVRWQLGSPGARHPRASCPVRKTNCISRISARSCGDQAKGDWRPDIDSALSLFYRLQPETSRFPAPPRIAVSTRFWSIAGILARIYDVHTVSVNRPTNNSRKALVLVVVIPIPHSTAKGMHFDCLSSDCRKVIRNSSSMQMEAHLCTCT